MQPDTEISANSPEDDEEDLFGSPPPSPGRGRSPSPGLALPSSSSGIALISQNVGTIALPGSQHDSELAVNPIALPFSDTRHGSPWPPANSLNHVQLPSSSSRCSSTSAGCTSASATPIATPSASRASSRAPSPKRKRKARARTPSVRPPPPVIPLPDPSAPPPPNWLRSQSALLGHAGLVGGVKPANLSHGQHRGSTPSNPIVIDDTINATNSQRAADRPKRTIRHSSYFGALSNLKLPRPETKDVVDILIRQKEVLPILKDLFQLLSQNPRLATAYRNVDGGMELPSKRRKLNHVPAGADDWDVPYPFQQGEGPQSYHNGWCQYRAKQLVSQLVTLIRTASRKAALRKFLREEHGFREKLEQQRAESLQIAALFKEIEHSLPKANGHYKPDTTLYGTDRSNVPETPKSWSPAPSESLTCSEASSSNDPPDAPGPLDDLISSLLTTTPITPSTLDISPDVTSTTNSSDTGDVDNLLDNWMSIFQSFPTEQHQNILSNTPPSQTATSAPAAVDTPTDFGPWSFSEPPSTNQPPSADFGEMATDFAPSLCDTQLMDVDSGVTQTIPDIDALFGLPSASSISHTDPLSVTIPKAPASGTPSLVASPIPSSLGDFPMTPTSGVGDDLHTNLGFGIDFGNGSSSNAATGMSDDVMNAVNSLMALGGNENADVWGGFGIGDGVGYDIHGASLDQNQTRPEAQPTPTKARMDSQGMWRRAIWNNMRTHYNAVAKGGDGSVRQEGMDGSALQEELAAAEAQEKEDVQTVNSVIPVLMSSVLPMTIPVKAQNVGTSSVFTPQTVKPHAKKSLDRKELLKIANERRKQLADEIVKTRIQLWETTVENGVLAHLSKFYV
ncbi:hypothetical protein PQX77_010443 [Marasmius sp. AFHP31]|nr:hypothetical protein PQX77_010443 [Marasmius sp. AFHP31]